MSLPVDHLVFAAPDLAAGIELVTRLTGVRPVDGGAHPGLGTRNALLGLGERTYLEIVGPDPEQPAPSRPRPFWLDSLDSARLVTYACRDDDLDGAVAAARGAGLNLGEPRPMRRTRPDGVELSWRLTPLDLLTYDGLVPFLIDWGDTPSPVHTSPGGCRLTGLRALHPEPDPVRAALRVLRVDVPVAPAAPPGLVATLDTPNGPVELR